MFALVTDAKIEEAQPVQQTIAMSLAMNVTFLGSNDKKKRRLDSGKKKTQRTRLSAII